MKIAVLLFILLGAVVIYLKLPKINSYFTGSREQQIKQVESTKVSPQQAVENVKNLPEVQKYLKNVPKGRVEVDNEDESEYNVHVYEIKNGHTATFNWYGVNKNTGKTTGMFN